MNRVSTYQEPFNEDPDYSTWDYWANVWSDSSIAWAGQIIGTLPATQATVERVFSVASIQSEGRRGAVLGQDRLAWEVYIRKNLPLLPNFNV